MNGMKTNFMYKLLRYAQITSTKKKKKIALKVTYTSDFAIV